MLGRVDGLRQDDRRAAARRAARAAVRRLRPASIEAATGAPSARSGDDDGEPAFRVLETAALRRALAEPRAARHRRGRRRGAAPGRTATRSTAPTPSSSGCAPTRRPRRSGRRPATHRPLLDGDPEATLRAHAARTRALLRGGRRRRRRHRHGSPDDVSPTCWRSSRASRDRRLQRVVRCRSASAATTSSSATAPIAELAGLLPATARRAAVVTQAGDPARSTLPARADRRRHRDRRG